MFKILDNSSSKIIINITIYFENLIIRSHVLYVLNTHVNFVPIGYCLLYDLIFFLIYNFGLQKLSI